MATLLEVLRLIVVLPLFLLIAIAYLLLLPLIIPVCIGHDVWLLVRDCRFSRRMQSAGRCAKWEAVDRAIRSGTGTLFLEVVGVKPWEERAWWTPDCVTDRIPCELPNELWDDSPQAREILEDAARSVGDCPDFRVAKRNENGTVPFGRACRPVLRPCMCCWIVQSGIR
jgi:hypothetical protein